MESTLSHDNVDQIRKRLAELREAILAASREGDLRLDAVLTLRACRLRRRLLEVQAQMFR